MKKLLAIIIIFTFTSICSGISYAGCVENRGSGWKYYSTGCKNEKNKPKKDPRHGESRTPWDSKDNSSRDKKKKCYYDQWGQEWCDWD